MLREVPIKGRQELKGGDVMSKESMRRTRRNILAISGILAGATFSRLGGVKTAKALNGGPCTPTDPDDCICFMRGTLILTPNGERWIEDLRIGDPVATGTGDKPIARYCGVCDACSLDITLGVKINVPLMKQMQSSGSVGVQGPPFRAFAVLTPHHLP